MSEIEFIPQMEPWLGDEEKRAVADYMDSGGWLTEFRNTAQFEQAIAEYVGAKHCIASCNGTTALMMINYCLGLRPGDEVIVPNYTMIATPNSVVATGATPVFVDVEPGTLCMDLAAAKAALTPRTRAILYVAANGRYPAGGVGPLRDFAVANGLAFIEDACQALGSWYAPGQHMGTVGLAAAFSFSVPKVITTGQGGAIVTNDDAFAAKLRRVKDFGRSGGGNDIHGSIGYNFKFTEMQAVIGLEQMKKLPARVERKKAILRRYRAQLAAVPAIRFFEQDLALTTPWFIDVEVQGREALQTHLKACGIGTRIMYPPINKQEAYGVSGEYPVSNRIGELGLWLPSAAQLTDAQIDRICVAIATFYAGST
jgi:perosamine synthetase